MTNQANTSNHGSSERQQPQNEVIAPTVLSPSPNTPAPNQEIELVNRPPSTDVSVGDHDPSLVECSSVVVTLPRGSSMTSSTDASVQDPSIVVTPPEVSRGFSATVTPPRMLYRRGSSLTPPREVRPSHIGGRRFSMTPPRVSSAFWMSSRGPSSATHLETTLSHIGGSPLTSILQGLPMVVGGSITVGGGSASAPPALPTQGVKRGPGPICSVCLRYFSSWKALFGHLRCHPEREWRGCFPPPVGKIPQADHQPPPQGEFDLKELAQEGRAASSPPPPPPPPPPAAGANEGDDRFDLNMPPPNEEDNEGTPGPAT